MTWLHIPDVAMLVLCFGMSLLGTWLNGFDAGNPLGNIFLGYLVGTEDAAGMVLSDFPVLNWLLFPVSGYVFGRQLLHVRDKTPFYMFISPICILITAVYFTVGTRNGSGMFGEGQNCYYHLETPDAIACLTFPVRNTRRCRQNWQNRSKNWRRRYITCWKQWPYLMRYLEGGRLEISNNWAERSINQFVMALKNWLFANTPRSQITAAPYS